MSAKIFLMDAKALEAMAAERAGVSIDSAQVRAFFDDADPMAPGYSLQGRTAIIDVHGALSPRADVWTWLFGGAICGDIAQAVRRADAAPNVDRIILDISSPGGAVEGVHSLVETIRATSTPTIALATGMAASGAYWLACACDEIVAAPSAMIGSLGAQVGVMLPGKTYVQWFTSSLTPNKNAAPDSDAGAQLFQQRADDIAEIFLGDVAVARGLPDAAAVSTAYGAGGVFVGTRAQTMGMVDRLSTSSAIDFARTLTKESGMPGKKPAGAAGTQTQASEAPEAPVVDTDATNAAPAAADVSDPPTAQVDDQAQVIADLQRERDEAKNRAAAAEQARVKAEKALHEQARAAFLDGEVARASVTPAQRTTLAALFDAAPTETRAHFGGLPNGAAIDTTEQGDGTPPDPPVEFETADQASAKFMQRAQSNKTTYAIERDLWVNSNQAAGRRLGFID